MLPWGRRPGRTGVTYCVLTATTLEGELKAYIMYNLRHSCLGMHSHRQQRCQSTHKALPCKAPDIGELDELHTEASLSLDGAKGTHEGCAVSAGSDAAGAGPAAEQQACLCSAV